jgi:hypothetical protein
MTVGVRTLSTCELVGCGHTADFNIQHPDRGEMIVCGYHARTISESLGPVEVAL